MIQTSTVLYVDQKWRLASTLGTDLFLALYPDSDSGRLSWPCEIRVRVHIIGHARKNM